jgi:hypothetical protein
VDREELLTQLANELSILGDDYNEEVEGYFGGSLDGDVLSVSFSVYEGRHEVTRDTAKWRLVPIEED